MSIMLELSTLLQNLTDENPAIRSQAALELGNLGKEEAIPTLSHTLLEDENPEVRRRAAEALGKLGKLAAVATYQVING